MNTHPTTPHAPVLRHILELARAATTLAHRVIAHPDIYTHPADLEHDVRLLLDHALTAALAARAHTADHHPPKN